jgi:hypothetical protein
MGFNTHKYGLGYHFLRGCAADKHPNSNNNNNTMRVLVCLPFRIFAPREGFSSQYRNRCMGSIRGAWALLRGAVVVELILVVP